MAVAFVTLCFGALGAYVWTATGSADEPGLTAVRQVFTERWERPPTNGSTTVAETWTLVDRSGTPISFVGFYRSESGELQQVQVRSQEGERVIWSSYRDGSTCVEVAPPAPNGMLGLIPGRWDTASLTTAGYERGGQLGEAGSSSAPGPLTTAATSFDLRSDEVQMWTRTMQDGDASKVRTLAIGADGFELGFWSTTLVGGHPVSSNSRVLALTEAVSADQFTEAMKEVNLDVPECR